MSEAEACMSGRGDASIGCQTTSDGALTAPDGSQITAELFVSDIHGEYESFSQLMRGACGEVRAAVDAVFAAEDAETTLPEGERAQLATLIAHPVEKLERALAGIADEHSWLAQKTAQIAAVLRHISAARTHGELLRVLPEGANDAAAAARAMESEPADLLGRETADLRTLLVDLAETAQRLAVGAVHMVGDVYDRGPAPDLVMDELARWPSLDVQWGNHDILWMGAALGQPGSVANAVRICARYNNLSILERTYGIDLAPLYAFAREAYADDPCVAFAPKGASSMPPDEAALVAKVQKAMAFIQFKAEARLIDQNPAFGLDDRNLLHMIDYDAGTVVVDGVTHELLDRVFPTVDPRDPYRMTAGEREVFDHLCAAFMGCERLQRHMRLFLEKGGLYKVDGDLLLFHACVPLNPDGTCKVTSVLGEPLAGKALFDAVDAAVRDAYAAQDPVARKRGLDLLWYLWLGEGSPLFAKSKMATFELYLVEDKAARKEVKNSFYSLLDDPKAIDGIFEEFGMDPACSRIVCGHVPVKVKDGENPVRCDGRVLMIDGGMSRAYQATTGIAGLALRRDAQGLRLGSLRPFCGTEVAVEQDRDLELDWRELE